MIERVVLNERKVFGRVYTITNQVNGMQYVGQTTAKRIQDYWKGHLRFAKNNAIRPLYDAIREFGPENFKFEVVCAAYDQQMLDQAEDQFIISLGTLAPHGYNMQGGGRLGARHSVVLRQKQSVAQTKSLSRPELREKISASVTAHFEDPANRQRQRQKTLDLFADPDYRERHRSAHNTPEYRARMATIQVEAAEQKSVLMSMTRWITDGVNNRRTREDRPPKGWRFGRAKTPGILRSAAAARAARWRKEL